MWKNGKRRQDQKKKQATSRKTRIIKTKRRKTKRRKTKRRKTKRRKTREKEKEKEMEWRGEGAEHGSRSRRVSGSHRNCYEKQSSVPSRSPLVTLHSSAQTLGHFRLPDPNRSCSILAIYSVCFHNWSASGRAIYHASLHFLLTVSIGPLRSYPTPARS